MIKLLVVDDSALMRRLMGQVFGAQADFRLCFARDGIEALAQLHAFQPDVVTLDVQMPHMDGLDCLDRIMVERPCAVVMVSSLTEAGAEATLQAMEAGAVDFIAKPGGAISLSIDALAPVLVATVRAASRARISSTHRLAERLRLRAPFAAYPDAHPGTPPGTPPDAPAATSYPARHACEEPRAPIRVPARRGPADGVVLVGCSTGGPPALDVLLGALPADFPWPVLVAQHMPSSFTGPLARRLDRLCALDVVEVRQPVTLRPGLVCVARGDADMIVSGHGADVLAMAVPASAEHRWHPSVDRLVLSAMTQLGAGRLTGVLMTGMGNDGAAAMTRLSSEGGRTIAESRDTAVVWGMPGELVRSGGAQVVAPLDEIPARLLALLP